MKNLILAVVLCVVASCTVLNSTTISGAEARELVKNGATLIDVRSPEEFAAAHIEGAKNIPVDEVDARLAEFGNTSSKIVVYCASGMRSAKAQSLLKSHGYASVYNLGARKNW